MQGTEQVDGQYRSLTTPPTCLAWPSRRCCPCCAAGVDPSQFAQAACPATWRRHLGAAWVRLLQSAARGGGCRSANGAQAEQPGVLEAHAERSQHGKPWQRTGGQRAAAVSSRGSRRTGEAHQAPAPQPLAAAIRAAAAAGATAAAAAAAATSAAAAAAAASRDCSFCCPCRRRQCRAEQRWQHGRHLGAV